MYMVPGTWHVTRACWVIPVMVAVMVVMVMVMLLLVGMG